jgi:hypothetical protein
LDKKAFTEIETRLLEVNKVVEKLDPTIKVTAFEFLKPYIVGETIKLPKHGDDSGGEAGAGDTGSSGDLAALVEKYGSVKKAADNAKVLTAWWFSQYGSAPFTIKWIKKTSKSTGVTIPKNPDMTFRQSKYNGKGVYNAVGKKGLFEITVAGETFLRTTYKVKKGTKTPPTDAK